MFGIFNFHFRLFSECNIDRCTTFLDTKLFLFILNDLHSLKLVFFFIQEHEYHVTFYNSAVQGAGTTSDVFLKLYGRDGADRERWFNNQQCQLRVDGATNQIKLRTRERLGDLSKVKVGLEAKGSSPGWLLDKVCQFLLTISHTHI